MDTFTRLALGLMLLIWGLAFLLYLAPPRHPWSSFRAVIRICGFLLLALVMWPFAHLRWRFQRGQARRIAP